MDSITAGPARYATPNGDRPARSQTFQIFSSWTVSGARQLVGPETPELLTEGGKIGCDEQFNGLTFPLTNGGKAIIFAQPLVEETPKNAYSVIDAWQIVGDRVLIPQPASTIEPGLDATSVDHMSYNGHTVLGSSISLPALEDLVKRLAA